MPQQLCQCALLPLLSGSLLEKETSWTNPHSVFRMRMVCFDAIFSVHEKGTVGN